MRTLAAIENVFFLVIVALVGLGRWVLAALESKRNEEAAKRARAGGPNAPVERAPAQTEEERVRRFMEALGVPTTSTPPPKTQPRRVTPKTPRAPKRKISPVDPFPIPRTTTWSPEPVVVVPPPLPAASTPPPPTESIPSIPPRVIVATAQQRAPSYDVQDVTGATQPGSVVRQQAITAPAGWAARLASAEGARDAIILREIFGPPRSMQPLNEIRAT